MKTTVALLGLLLGVASVACTVDSEEPAPPPAKEAKPDVGETQPQFLELFSGEDCPAPCYTWIYGRCKYNGSCTHNAE